MMGLLFFSSIPCAWAQTKLDVNGVVTDERKAIVVGAEVTITLAEDETVSQVTKTDNQGRFHFSALPAGTYKVTVFADTFDLSNTELKLDKPQTAPYTVTLTQTVKTVIEVNAEQSNLANVETANNGNAIILGPEDLESLPDDPDDLLAALKDMAGPASGVDDASVYVDGFLERGRIPPKEAILRVMINANPYSPEFSEPGFSRIQIITKPGTDIFHASAGFRFNDESLNAKNPFVQGSKPPHQLRNYTGSLAGPIIKGKAAFFFDIDRNENDNDELVNALVPNPADFVPGLIFPKDPNDPKALIPPTINFNQTVLTPSRLLTFNIRSDYMLRKNNTLMVGYRFLTNSTDNSGASNFVLPSRVSSSNSRDNQLRISDTQIINANMLNEFRVQIDSQHNGSQALSNDVQINVPQFFNSGGSQAFDQRNTRSIDLNENFSIIHGNHSMKFGTSFNLNNLNDNNRGNFEGSFSFVNLAQYIDAVNGDPTSRANTFTITSGIPTANTTMWRFGFFGMDDWKVRPNFTLSTGIRWEAQTHLQDKWNPAPRIAIAWSPDSKGGANGKTSIRAGFGMFYNQLSEGALLAVDRQDGLHQIVTVIPCASFPDPFATPSGPCPDPLVTIRPIAAPSIREFETGLKMPYTIQWNVGVDRTLPKGFFVSTTFTRIKGVHLFHTIDLNQPLTATSPLPFPGSGPILQVQSDANFIRDMIAVNVRRQISKYFTINVNYVLGRSNSDYGGGGVGGGGISGIFSVPMNSYDPHAEWGRADGDARHTVFITGTASLPRGFRLAPNIRYSTGNPFNIILSRDINSDTRMNDRPAFGGPNALLPVVTEFGTFDLVPQPGEVIIPRNFGENPGRFSFDLALTKTFGWGEARRGGWQAPPDASGGDQGGQRGRQGGGRPGGGGPRGGGGGGGRGGGGGGRGGFGGGGFGGGNETSKRYNFTFSLRAQNVFNLIETGNLNNQLPTSPSQLLPPGTTTPVLGKSLFGTANTVGNRPRTIEASLRFNW